MSAVREADIGDLDALMRLEQACFAADAQSRRSMRWLLVRANARVRIIDAAGGGPAGYAISLYRRTSRVARLYSIAVADTARGQGIGARLIADALAIALGYDMRAMRAEARLGNRASRGLFAAAGFIETERLINYYPGPEDGIRLEKQLERD